MTVQLQSFVQPVAPQIPTPTTITNVVATLRGTDPVGSKRVYVVASHYDSRVSNIFDSTSDAPGADDDGSGVAAMLELARLMATRPVPATIVFAAFGGKEQGLYGSEYFAAQEKAGSVNIQGVLNLDIIGNSLSTSGVRNASTIRVFSEGVPTNATAQQISQIVAAGGENDGSSRQLARYIHETGGNKVTRLQTQMVWRRDRLQRLGDQISFLMRGYPAVRFTEANENYLHQQQDVGVDKNGVQHGDLARFLDFGYLTRVTKVVGSSLWMLANAPGAPTNARIINGPLSVDTELRWDASPETDVTGYEVVWRDSASTDWSHTIPVGKNVTGFTVPGSITVKDNAQFGVRAVNKDGLRSPVAYAAPASR